MKIELYSLEGCGYSKAAEALVKEKKLKKITKIIKVKYEIKEKYKKKNKMETFPQIFIIDNKKKHKIGGFNDFESLIEIIDDIKDKTFNVNTLCMFNKLINQKKSNKKNNKNNKNNKK